MSGEFKQPPLKIEMREGAVHVWRMDVDTAFSNLAELRQYLSEQECMRVDRLLRPLHQYRAQVAYAALRSVLSRYVGIAPKELIFTQGSHGKPYLIMPDEKIYFNMTHSDSMLLIAITQNCEIGIDVERVNESIEFSKLAERFFAKEESIMLKTLSQEQQLRGFYRCWTRKEAYVKAIGLGLSFALKDFVVSLKPQGLDCLISIQNETAEAGRWSLGSIEIHSNFEAAVALPRKVIDWEFFNLDSIP